jgi:hypothetical protein
MDRNFEEKLSAEFPVEFLTIYGPRFYQVVDVLGEMASRGEVSNVLNAARLFKLLIDAAAVVASEIQGKKEANEWRPRFVI